MIPHIIHQIWLQGELEIPDKFNNNIQSIKRHHPTWTYIVWDEIKILQMLQKCPKAWLKTYYNLLYLHQKVDYGRYVILYLYGGVYLDIDVESVRPLDKLLEDNSMYDVIVSKLSTSNFLEGYVCCRASDCINNGIIMSSPHSEHILELIDEVNNNPNCGILTNKFLCIQNTTGPAMFTRIMNNKQKSHTSRTKILDSEYLEPCSADMCTITANTYTAHRHEQSWVGGESIRHIENFYHMNKNNFGNFCCSSLIVIVIFIILYFLYRSYQS